MFSFSSDHLILQIFPLLLPLLLAPLLLGIINRVKAIFAGRTGSPLLQSYYDIVKLLRKDFIYSKTTTWIFRVAPLMGLATVFILMLIMPMHSIPAICFFKGDILLFLYLMGLSRFFMTIAALDTGSSFEGMGAAREVFFATLAEPILMMIFITLAYSTHSLSLTTILQSLSQHSWMSHPIPMMLLFVALFFVLLLELSRIPFDDPNTHLELTMIHEVIVLDYASFDLGIIFYTQALKLWLFSSLLVQLLFPMTSSEWWEIVLVQTGGVVLISIIIGIVESSMARFRMNKIPQILIGALVLSSLAMILLLV